MLPYRGLALNPRLPALSLLMLVLADPLARLVPGLGWAAVLLWTAGCLIWAGDSAMEFGRFLVNARVKRHFVTAGTALLLVVVHLSQTANPARLSHEATQQTNCVMMRLK